VSSLRSASGSTEDGSSREHGSQLRQTTRQRYVPELSKVEGIVITAKIVIVWM
jgi:hypothetical protein